LQKGVTNAAFDTAMFALKKGEISRPVLTPDGYDIIWLRDTRSGEAKSFRSGRVQYPQLFKEQVRKPARTMLRSPRPSDGFGVGMSSQGAARFGYRVRQVAGEWRWTAFDGAGRVCGEGCAASRAAAAAHVIRVLAEESLKGRDEAA